MSNTGSPLATPSSNTNIPAVRPSSPFTSSNIAFTCRTQLPPHSSASQTTSARSVQISPLPLATKPISPPPRAGVLAHPAITPIPALPAAISPLQLATLPPPFFSSPTKLIYYSREVPPTSNMPLPSISRGQGFRSRATIHLQALRFKSDEEFPFHESTPATKLRSRLIHSQPITETPPKGYVFGNIDLANFL